MRHRKKFNHLSRKSAHRKAMLTNMAISLIEHKRIKTTVAKAKALRVFVEPLINRTKDDTTHSRRMVFRKLQNKNAVTELFREVSQKVADRKGGYTRILKMGNRLGDNAEMCIIELVDYNENYFSEKTAKSTKKRTRRGKAKDTSKTVETNKQEEKVEDTIVEEKQEEKKTEDVKSENKVEDKTEEIKEDDTEEKE
ncbi:MAG: 50S ribosomal protein L17 [Bacteroidales bacterium]|nr:50S ribosomal protein L17 [Bacteroidales bacterium]